MIENNIFKNKFPIFDKLVKFGFVLQKDVYLYCCSIVDGQFNLNIEVNHDGNIKTKLVDPDTEEEYILHLAENAVGRFVGRVRTEYFDILKQIADNCFETKIFQTKFANEIIQYIYKKYQDHFEYLWNKFPDNAIVRRRDNQKWYALLLTVKPASIGIDGSEKIEIIDIRMPPEKIEVLVDQKKYFAGYHMNKKHWITMRLDGSVDLQEIFNLIDQSYILAKNNKSSK